MEIICTQSEWTNWPAEDADKTKIQTKTKDPAPPKEPDLIQSVMDNDIENVIHALDNNADVNIKNAAGITPLTLAVMRGRKILVKILLEQGAKVDNESLLHAAEWGFGSIVSMLLRAGASIHYKGSKGMTALMAAANLGNLDVVNILLKHDAEVVQTNLDGESALFHAVRHGYLDITKILLRQGSDLHKRNAQGETPFLVAAASGQTQMIEFLLHHGANAKDQDNSGNTALMKASTKARTSVVKMLLDLGLRHNIVCAAQDRCPEVSHLLTAGVFRLKPKDALRKSQVLMVCIANGFHNTAKMLRSYSCFDVNAVNKAGDTALLMAAEAGCNEIVRMLISRGALVGLKNNGHQTALDMATMRKRVLTMKLLNDYAA